MVIFSFFPHKSMTDIQVQHKGCFLLQYAVVYCIYIQSNVCITMKTLAGILWRTFLKWMDIPPLVQPQLLNLATY